GGVRLAERVGDDLSALRAAARAELFALPATLCDEWMGPDVTAIGCSGSVRALVAFATGDARRYVTRRELSSAVEELGRRAVVELAGALIAGGLGLPLPEELVLLTGGYHAWRGDVDARALIAVTLAAVLVGDATLYVLGRYGGRPLVQRFVGDARLERLDRAFAARGAVLMFF